MSTVHTGRAPVRAAGPHLQLFRCSSGGAAGREASTESPTWWRLLAANHRDLGRSCAALPGPDAALNDIAALRARLTDLVPRVFVDSNREHWIWVLALDGELRARSSRGYSRRVECALSARQFAELIAVAVVDDVVHVYPGFGPGQNPGPNHTSPPEKRIQPNGRRAPRGSA